MSQLVYWSPNNRFFAQPGIIQVGLSETPITITSGSGPSRFPMEYISDQVPAVTSIDGGTGGGEMVFNTSGVFAVTLSLQVTGASTQLLEPEIHLLFVDRSSAQFILASTRTAANPKLEPVSGLYYTLVTVSATFFATFGDTLAIDVYNRGQFDFNMVQGTTPATIATTTLLIQQVY
jgi:hypothetical protein